MKPAFKSLLFFCYMVVIAPNGFAQSGIITTYAGGARPIDGTQALTQPVVSPAALIPDGAGGFFFTDIQQNQVYRVTSGGVIIAIAGNGQFGFRGDGGPATAASLAIPTGLARDAAGNLYISDRLNHRIRKVNPAGIISSVAGNGTPGFSGDGGAATSASLNYPSGVAVDATGSLLIADSDNKRVRKVSPGGLITTLAGNGTSGSGGDGGLATSATFREPYSIAVDLTGNLFIADRQDRRVRKIDTAGFISTLVSGVLQPVGFPLYLPIDQPQNISADPAGNIYVSDPAHSWIVRVSPAGTVSTIAGNGAFNGGFSGDGGPATSARLANPVCSAVDSIGNVLICDSGNHRVRVVSPGGVINTVAGNGNDSTGFSGDGGPAISAALNAPIDVAADNFGNLFISDEQNSRVRKVSAGGTISTIAGNGVAGYSGDGGQATSASLSRQGGIAVDTTGNVYIADMQNNRVRKVTAGGVISTIAGNGTSGFSGDGGPAAAAAIAFPSDVAVDAAGNLFIADRGNHRIRKVTPAGVITTIAGTGIPGFGGDNGPASSASLSTPSGVAVDAAGNVYIADTDNFRVRKVTPAGVITTIAGNGTVSLSNFVSGDGGQATSASLTSPVSIAVDTFGNVFIADWGNYRVRKVTPGGWISTITGNGFQGSAGDGGPAVAAMVTTASGVAVDLNGNVFIADINSSRVRKIGSRSRSDFNSDGRTDILWRNTVGDVSMWLLNGYSITNNSFIGNVWNGWTIAGTGDFDADGKSDILWRDSIGNAALWLMDGTNVSKFGDIGMLPTSWAVAGVADFNADGRADILWRDSSGDVAIWLMNGFIVTNSNSFIANIWPGWAIVGTGDFDADGKADILWRDASGDVAIWIMNGTTVTSGTNLGNIWTGWKIVGTADFDGNGRADILWRDASGNVAMWLMSGATVTSGTLIANIWVGWAIVGIGDYNGDGRSDILWRDTTGNAAIWIMDGTSVSSSGGMGNVSDRMPQ